MNKYIEESEKYLMHTYNRYQIVLEKGDGVYLYDTEGKRYLDFAAGIAVFALGYGNRDYNNALKNQIDKIIHTSNLYYNVPLSDAAKNVARHTGMDKVFFTNSGTEAIEGAIKLARKYSFQKYGEGRNQIISMNHSFHGRSIGALSVTGQPKYQEAFRPLIGGVEFAEFNRIESVKEKINDKTCAVIAETVQGEGGLYPAEKGFLQELKRLCEEKDIVLILDEIQCGMGRTGFMFAYQDYDLKPDIVTSAKALGCGIPVGAFAAVKKVADAFQPGDHGTTYGGNPLAAAAVNKVFELFEDMDLVNHVKKVSAYLEQKLDEIANEFDFIKERRGKGLMQGLEFTKPAGEYIKKAMERGLILISAGPDVLRFVPPLIVTEENIDEMTRILKECLKEV